MDATKVSGRGRRNAADFIAQVERSVRVHLTPTSCGVYRVGGWSGSTFDLIKELMRLNEELEIQHEQEKKMQKQTGKVVQIQGAGDWKNRHGDTMYSFEYTVDNGEGFETFTANHKTQQPRFKEGDEVQYQITGENEHGKRGKVDKPFEQSTAHSSRMNPQSAQAQHTEDTAKRLSIWRSVALQEAVKYLTSQTVVQDQGLGGHTDVTGLADAFYEWLKG